MKNLITSLPIACLVMLQCTPSAQKESNNPVDSAKVVTQVTPSQDANQSTKEENGGAIDVEYLTKYPFESDHVALRNELVEAGFVVKDTTLYDHVIILFDSSRVEINDADDNQDVIGDLICSANIQSSRFRFSQAVSIGMSQSDFLSKSNLTKTAIKDDPASGKSYYQNEIPFNDGHWKIVLWFKDGLLIEIEYEISPCEIEYDT